MVATTGAPPPRVSRPGDSRAGLVLPVVLDLPCSFAGVEFDGRLARG